MLLIHTTRTAWCMTKKCFIFNSQQLCSEYRSTDRQDLDFKSGNREQWSSSSSSTTLAHSQSYLPEIGKNYTDICETPFTGAITNNYTAA